MTAIAVANKDWAIVDDIRAALAGAAIDGEAVFASVTLTAGELQAAQSQLHRWPAAIVRYETTREDDSPEDVRGCAVALELLLAAAVSAPATDELARIREALRLKNAAVNAVEADPPAGACAWGDGRLYHRAIQWGRPRIDPALQQPWVLCRLPLEIGFVLDGPTSH